MRLRLSVVAPGTTTALRHVAIEAPAGTPVSAVADQLRAAAGVAATVSDDERLYVGGVTLPRDAPLGEPPLVAGAVVAVGAPRTARRLCGVLQLRVVGGPDAGRSYALEPGTHVVGRAAGAAVRVADPDVSRAHAEVTLTWDGAVLRDLGSTNGTLLDGAPVGAQPVALPVDAMVVVGASTVTLTAPEHVPAAATPDGAGRVDINRPPRLVAPPPEVKVILPASPRARERPRLPTVSLVLPLVGGLAMALLLRNATFLLFTMLAPLMVVGQWLSDGAARRRESRSEGADFAARTAEAHQRAAAAAAEERRARRSGAPDPAELRAAAELPTARLWERRLGDDDAMLVRVGLGELPARLRVEQAGRDAASPPQAPYLLADVPVTVPLAEAGSLGIAGPRPRALPVLRWAVLQLAVLHSPRDVELVVLAPGHSDEWEWAAWLPHVQARPPWTCRALVATDMAHVDARVADLLAQLDAHQESVAGRPVRWTGRRTVIVLDGARSLRTVPGVARLLDEGPAVGLHFLCLAQDGVSLPVECGARATTIGDVATRLRLEVHGQVPVEDVRMDGVDAVGADRIARALAPLRDATPDGGQAALPPAVRLVDVLAGRVDAPLPTPEQIAQRWSVSRGRSTVATLGIAADGAFQVDLRRDGPHALVAGTTGAGKSELLQTMVTSLAMAHRPDELSFVLVDYKGGAAFAEAARLPHTVGLVTDLDGHLTTRALASLDAELRRRERLLRDAGVNDLDALAATAARRPARLVIVIDEFATLVEELPDFVRGLVGVAQRGRSLGVHLVLATQRPAGAVTADIRANTTLRLCLRVTDEADSLDVLGSRDAATISRATAGRGFARRGAEGLVAFQAARVSGRAGRSHAASPTVNDDPTDGLGDAIRRADAEDEGGPSDLCMLVDVLRAAADRLPLQPVPSPWLAPLPRLVPAATLTVDGLTDGDDPDGAVPVLPYALADLPREQRQAPQALDLAVGGHLLVVGAPRSGRSTVLRTIAAQVGLLTSPGDVHIYGIDAGSGALRPLADLPHCGAVVAADQPERVDQLLSWLTGEVRRRQSGLAEDGYGDVAEQRAHAPVGERLPYLLVLLDRWEGCLALLDEIDGGRLTDAFLRLLREGPAVGVRVVVTADRSGLVGRVGSAVEDKVVLRLSDPADYALAGLNARQVPDALPPGRGVRAGDGVEVQLALPGADPSGPGQVAHLREVAARARAEAASLPVGRLPHRVDELPQRIGWRAALGLSDPRSPAGRGSASPSLPALVGVGGDRLAALHVDLAADGPGFVVAGPARSGRSTALLAIVASLVDAACPVLVVCPRPSPLRELLGHPMVREVLTGASTDLGVLQSVTSEPGPVAVVVDDGELLVDGPLGPGLEAFLRGARDVERVLVVGGTTAELAAGFRGYVVEARKARTGLLLGAESPLDGDLLGVRLPRTQIAGGPAGRGALVVRGVIRPVQVPAVEVGDLVHSPTPR